MEYSIDMCSTYTCYKLGSKDVYVFDEHNMALPVWGTHSAQKMAALSLVTFDTHADTRNPFARFMGRAGCTTNRKYMDNLLIKEHLKDYHYLRTDFSFEDVWRLSVCDVAHDEQIQTAVDWGYLASYTVVCGLSKECAKDYQQQDEWDGLPAKYISRCDWFSVAAEIIDQHDHAKLVMDYDLDFFRCADDMNEEFIDSIKPLISQSQVITIARERACFDSVSLDSSFTNDDALKSLLRIIKNDCGA